VFDNSTPGGGGGRRRNIECELFIEVMAKKLAE
jgi:hypothetical protein